MAKKFKTVLITGGSKGIGLKLAQIFAKKKYNIVLCGRNTSKLKKAKKEIEFLGVSCQVVKTDVSNYNSCKSLVKKAIKKFKSIDVLINNAGIQGPIGKLWTNDINRWKKTVEINLLGTYNMCRLVIPQMLKQKSGKIINLSGGGAAYARPSFSAYATSKTAILRLTECLNEELKGKNIQVTALAPGAVWTDMTKEILKNKNSLPDKKELLKVKKTGGTPFYKLDKMINLLISNESKKLSGKLVHVNEIEKIKRKKSFKSESGLLRRVDYK